MTPRRERDPLTWADWLLLAMAAITVLVYAAPAWAAWGAPLWWWLTGARRF